MSDTSFGPKCSYLPCVKFTPGPGGMDAQWAPAQSLRFVVLISLALWSVILGAAAALI